jgi:hypothetical protein
MVVKKKDEKRGINRKLDDEEIKFLLDEGTDSENKCFTCNMVELTKEEYRHGDSKELKQLWQKSEGWEINLSKLWTMELKLPKKEGGAVERENMAPVCLNCKFYTGRGTQKKGDPNSSQRRISLPNWAWRKIDLIVENEMEFEHSAKMNDARVIRNAVFRKAVDDYSTTTTIDLREYWINYVLIRLDATQADSIVKRNLGGLASKGEEMTHKLNHISRKAGELVESMNLVMKEFEELIPENSKDIFLPRNMLGTDIDTLYDAGESAEFLRSKGVSLKEKVEAMLSGLGWGELNTEEDLNRMLKDELEKEDLIRRIKDKLSEDIESLGIIDK